MGKTAIVIGATGLTGGLLMKELIRDERYTNIKLLTRRNSGFQGEKIEEHIVDLLDYNSWTDLVSGNDLFCCIGTTRKKTPDLDKYREIDFGIPYHAAKSCKLNGVDTFSVVSAIGANSKSSIFYNRLKGEMEEAVQDEGPDRVYIMRPSIIDGDRGEKRFLEQFGLGVFRVLGFLLIGKLKKYKLIHARDIAMGMITVANSGQKSAVFESDEIKELVKNA